MSNKEEKAPFSADWKSLQAYECPEWFRDAKFGIYAHWGPYTVSGAPGMTDWYSRNMYIAGSPENKYHLETFGSLDKFGYKDFVPMFTADAFDPEEWAELFAESGARFAGPVAEHADGFAMWDSEITRWNAKAMGPRRDVVGELKKAIKGRGMKYVATFHHQWKFAWYPTMDTKTDASNPEYADLYGPAVPTSGFGDFDGEGYDYERPNPSPDAGFGEEWLNKVVEVVDAYEPDLLWFDNRMIILPEIFRKKMAAHFYNRAAEKGTEVVMTFKRPDMVLGTGTVDLERNRMPDIFPEPWLTDTSVASNSWAYSSDMEYYSTERIVHDLVDIVSKNGCMLLNIAPAADGSIPEVQKAQLREIGRWLKVNGEAIYESRPWLVYGEGPTETPEGHLADLNFSGWSREDVRFTQRDGFLYATAFGWPEDGEPIRIKRLGRKSWNETIRSIELLGAREQVRFEHELEELRLFPVEKPAEGLAYVFKIRMS